MDMLSYLGTFIVLHMYYNGCQGKQDMTVDVEISNPNARPGQQTTISCHVTYPVKETFFIIWQRRLGKDQQKFVEMGTNAVANAAFEETNRYDIIINNTIKGDDSKPSEATFVMTIEDLQLSDSGEIGCIVPGKNIEQHKELIVFENVKSIVLKSSIEGKKAQAFDQNGTRLTMEEGEKRTFECIVNGSYPAPEVKVFFGDKDVTNLFQMAKNPELSKKGKKVRAPRLRISPHPVSQVEGYEVKLKTIKPMEVNYTFNDKLLNCVATMPDNTYPQSSMSVNLNLTGFKPHFLCEHKQAANMHENNVTIRCNVVSSPPVDQIKFYWESDKSHGENHSVVLFPGKKNDAELVLVDAFSNSDPITTVMLLTITRLGPQHFRTYYFEATNDYATVTHSIKLVEEGGAQETGNLAGAGSQVVAGLLAPVCLTLLLLIASLRSL